MARFASCRNHALTHVPACLGQSFELARVLEGEKAQRGEVAKKLADLSRRLAHANAVEDGAAAAALGLERAVLDSQLQRHSAHVSLLASRPCDTHPCQKEQHLSVQHFGVWACLHLRAKVVTIDNVWQLYVAGIHVTALLVAHLQSAWFRAVHFLGVWNEAKPRADTCGKPGAL